MAAGGSHSTVWPFSLAFATAGSTALSTTCRRRWSAATLSCPSVLSVIDLSPFGLGGGEETQSAGSTRLLRNVRDIPHRWDPKDGGCSTRGSCRRPESPLVLPFTLGN